MKEHDNNTATEGPFTSATHAHCSDPSLGDLIFSHPIGDLSNDTARALELHVRECIRCQADQVRLKAVDRIVRANPKKFFGRSKKDDDTSTRY